MAYEWIAAAASAAASLGSSLAMSTKKRGSTRTMEVAKELAQYNNELSRSNWQLENAYNSPAAQMERYREAGLNPNLIYGQSNTGGSIQSGAVDTDPTKYEGESKKAEMLAGLANAISTYQQIRSNQIQMQNAQLVGALTAARTASINQKTSHDQQMSAYQLEQAALNVKDKQWKVQYKNIADLNKTEADINYQIGKYYNVLEDTTLKKSQRKQIEEQISNLKEERSLITARRGLVYQQIGALQHEMSLSAELQPLKKALMGSQARIYGYQGDLLYKNVSNYDADRAYARKIGFYNRLFKGYDLGLKSANTVSKFFDAAIPF